MSSHPLFEVLDWFKSYYVYIHSDSIPDLIRNAPGLYKAWWAKLYAEAPEHILIETGLVCFIIWLLLIRKTIDPNKPTKQKKLSAAESEWLIETWTPEPLVPALTGKQHRLADEMPVSQIITINIFINIY